MRGNFSSRYGNDRGVGCGIRKSYAGTVPRLNRSYCAQVDGHIGIKLQKAAVQRGKITAAV